MGEADVLGTSACLVGNCNYTWNDWDEYPTPITDSIDEYTTWKGVEEWYATYGSGRDSDEKTRQEWVAKCKKISKTN